MDSSEEELSGFYLDGLNTRNPKPLSAQGDLIIIAHHPTKPTVGKWLVSSSILRLTSPSLNDILSCHFEPSSERMHEISDASLLVVFDGTDTVLNIPEMDPEALDLVLSALHYQDVKTELAPDMLGLVARICTELTCHQALRPRLELWFQNVRTPSDIKEYGSLFSAAYALELNDCMITTSKLLIRNAKAGPATTWISEDAIDIIPNELQEKITSSISTALYEIYARAQSINELLQEYPKAYYMNRQLCPRCGRLHPSEANKCSPCHKFPGLVPAMCTRESRLGEYLVMLRQGGLWPSVVSINALCVSELVAKISAMAAGMKHKCEGEGNCPLVMAITGLATAVETISDNLPGIGLEWRNLVT